MTKSITIKGAEVTICGVTFIVNYQFTSGLPATEINPAEPSEVEIIRVEIKGQPEGSADELLEAIKINLRSTVFANHEFDNGFDLLEAKLLESHNQ